MVSLADLLRQHCRHVDGSPLSDAEVAAQLAQVAGWKHDAGALVKEYRFADYYETLAFVNALAFMVHREDHHPELRVTYNRCVVRFDTHSVGGISINDFICAAKADAIFAQHFGTTAA